MLRNVTESYSSKNNNNNPNQNKKPRAGMGLQTTDYISVYCGKEKDKLNGKTMVFQTHNLSLMVNSYR